MEAINICRVCFNMVKKKFEIIDAVTKQMLEVLSLKVDLNASENPIVCQDCAEIIRKSYLFKSACIDTEEHILSFSATQERAEFDIKDVYRDSKDVETVASEDLNICRFCMNQTVRNNCVSMDALINDALYVEMSPVFMPKMVLNIIKDPVICVPCKETLGSYFQFAKKCLNIENKINEYRRSTGTNSTSQIKLNDVQVFLFKDTLEYPSINYVQIPMIKQESLFEDVEQNVEMCEEQIKCEALEIKDEGANSQNNASKCKMHKCKICTYESKHKSNVKKHMIIHKSASEVELYKCKICTYESKYKDTLKRHILKHKDVSEVEMHKCLICTYETKYKTNLRNHMLIHKDTSEVKLYKCDTCAFETKYKNGLKKHILVHKDTSEIEIHKCSQCTYETINKTYLKKHMIIHKTVPEREMHKCGTCNFETKYKTSLDNHKIIHKDLSEVEVHNCAKCSYSTKFKNYLRSHMITHKDVSDVEMYKCGICTYETRYKGDLKKHVFIHKKTSKIEMYKCGMCIYETKYKGRLVSHMLIHKDAGIMHKCTTCNYETKFKSGICTFETRYKQNLDRHTVIHKK